MSAPISYTEVDDNGTGWEVKEYQAMSGTVYEHDQTDKKQLAPVIKNFACPVCGHDQFEVRYRNEALESLGRPRRRDVIVGPGPNAGMPRTSVIRIVGYECPECTTNFSDPAKFTKNKPPDIVPPVATPRPNPLSGLFDSLANDPAWQELVDQFQQKRQGGLKLGPMPRGTRKRPFPGPIRK